MIKQQDQTNYLIGFDRRGKTTKEYSFSTGSAKYLW